MTSKMGGQLLTALICCCLLGLATAEVTLKGSWQENFGWEVVCSWKTWLNDTVQSVRMSRNGNQFFIFRPEIHGQLLTQTIEAPDFRMAINCKMIFEGHKGRCIVKMELLKDAKEDTFKCEMSGETPTFRLEEREYTVFVPPSDATLKPIEQELTATPPRRELNCTSSGIPAPKLTFTVDTQKIPEDFTHTTWNNTTKVWHSWATYNPQQLNVVVTCSPEVATKLGSVERGQPAIWTVVANSGCCLGVIKLILLGSFILPLLR